MRGERKKEISKEESSEEEVRRRGEETHTGALFSTDVVGATFLPPPHPSLLFPHRGREG